MSHFEYEGEILQRLPVPLRREVVLYIHRCWEWWEGGQDLPRTWTYVCRWNMTCCICTCAHTHTLSCSGWGWFYSCAKWTLLGLSEFPRQFCTLVANPRAVFRSDVLTCCHSWRHHHFTRHLLSSKLLIFKDALPPWQLGFLDLDFPIFRKWLWLSMMNLKVIR